MFMISHFKFKISNCFFYTIYIIKNKYLYLLLTKPSSLKEYYQELILFTYDSDYLRKKLKFLIYIYVN
jgi:hypothetical protein